MELTLAHDKKKLVHMMHWETPRLMIGWYRIDHTFFTVIGPIPDCFFSIEYTEKTGQLTRLVDHMCQDMQSIQLINIKIVFFFFTFLIFKMIFKYVSVNSGSVPTGIKTLTSVHTGRGGTSSLSSGVSFSGAGSYIYYLQTQTVY